jgi:DNA-binding LytR/AlgR family response regulator
MNPVTALIAEDEPVLADALQRQLTQLWPELRIERHARDGEQALEAALELLPEVLFLDIHMPGLSGLEVAERVVEDWPDDRSLPQIVFITAYDEYAVQAFERAAIDYVLKPVRTERLRQTCQRLQGQLTLQRAAPAEMDDSTAKRVAAVRQTVDASPELLKVIQAASGHSVYVIPVEDVVYFEAADKYVRVVTRVCEPHQPERLIRTPLRELMPRLDATLFLQIHRSVVVNVRAIDRISRQHNRTRVHLRGREESLDVSRMYAHLFKSM